MDKQVLKSNKVIWLAAGVILASFPHWQRLPIWIPVSQILLIAARFYIPYKLPVFWLERKATISNIRLLLLVAGVVGIYGSFGTLTGREVGIALMVLLAGFKIFESNSTRDFFIGTYLGYFLIITNFFYSQTIPTATYMFVVIIIMTAGLIDFNDTEKQLTLFKRFRLSTTLLIQAIPILLVLFILFPRINGPLWGMPKDAYTGTTGVTDEMSPGSISELVESNEVAFRVTFDDQIPEQSKLYWRGPVLWHTDGRKWTTGYSNTDQGPSSIEFTGEAIDYDVMIEPSNKKWLFALEMVSKIPDKTYLTNDYQLKTRKSIAARQTYELTSFSSFIINKDEFFDLHRGLQLPEIAHPKTRELAARLKEEYKKPALIVQGAFEWLREQGFVYTLSPQLITGDTVDEFLFNSRQGFCEHYAAAFTILMRAAGIPARIVAGYQGGEVNPIGNYLIVRQRDAHAWTEVWLENRGWVRIDPTSIISPVRINEGINTSLPDAIADTPLGLDRNATVVRLWQRIRNAVDMANYQWAQWVLGYGPDRQRQFLKQLGINVINWKSLTVYLFFFLGIIVTVIAVIVFTRTPESTEPVKKYYDLFCKKMAKIGLTREAYEGPVDFAQRIHKARSDLKNETQHITNLYVLIRYYSDNSKLQQFKTAIRSFRPAKEPV